MQGETKKFELTEQEHKNLNVFLNMVEFHGTRQQVIPQLRELDRLLQIFYPQPKKPLPGKIQKKNADKTKTVHS